MRFDNLRRSSRLLALLALALVPACGDGTGSGGGNPVPALTSVSPTGVEAGAAAEITLTVAGSGFVRQSVVRVGGGDRVTEFVSASLLRARLTAADLAAGGAAQVTVFNPAPGGGVSGAAQFTVNNPGPLVQGVSPTSLPALSAGGTVTLTGIGFVPQSQVLTGATALQTTYVSATELRAAVTEAQLQSADALPLSVRNPAPGGGLSNETTIGVRAPDPVIASFSPGFVAAGSADVTVAVIGTGFVTQSRVVVNNTARQTTRVSSTELRVPLAAADMAMPGTLRFQVIGGGGYSAPVDFEVRAPVPTVTSLAPAQTAAGQRRFLLGVNGTGFAPGSVVRFNGVPRPTRWVSSTQLEVTLPLEDLRAAGSFPITVVTPAPGGGVSNAVPFTLVS